MKQITSRLAIAALLIAPYAEAAWTREALVPTDGDNAIAFDAALSCGDCVAGGFNFCWKSTVPAAVLSDTDFPTYDGTNEHKCCTNELCTEANNKAWICSWSYESPAYSFHVCPFKRSNCGPNSKLNFYDVGDDASIHIKSLPKGSACTYEVEARCGAPSFQAVNATGVSIYYTEWQQDKILPATPVVEIAMRDSKVLAASPLQGMPARAQTFGPIASAVAGASTPVYGAFTKNGWKTWGNKLNDGSDDSLLGRRYATTDETCAKRNMLISVVATSDDAQLLLELESRTFLATYLQGAAVAAVTMASLTLY